MLGSFEGAAQEFGQSLQNQVWLILAAVFVIYIVLGVLYESFIHPFTILTTLPSAGIGALLALQFFGMEFSFIALIGVILLMPNGCAGWRRWQPFARRACCASGPS